MLGVAAATSVICGALIVGDSMRGSLRRLTLDRLGNIDAVCLPGSYFQESLARQIADQSQQVSGILLFSSAVLEASAQDSTDLVRRAGSVQAIACDGTFWQMGEAGLIPAGTKLDGETVILNGAAAQQLNVQVGDRITVRLPSEQAVAADNPLGRRDGGTVGFPHLTVSAVLADRSLSRFSLLPNQQQPATVFLPLRLVQETLDRRGQVNTLLIRFREGKQNLDLPLTLADYGLNLSKIERKFASESGERVLFDYWSLTSERLILPDAVSDAVLERLGDELARPVMTYLANALYLDRDPATLVVYSLVSGIDDGPEFPLIEQATGMDTSAAASFLGASMPDPDPPVVLNQWTADRLGAVVGDRLHIEFFQPETIGGAEIEAKVTARVAGIVPLTIPARPASRRTPAIFELPPSRFNDPDLTPLVPGVTDQETILDWDLPFSLKYKSQVEDDRYWNEQRLTPKAFLPYTFAKSKFGSRFGKATSIMIDSSQEQEQLEREILAALLERRQELGWSVRPIRSEQLEASRGTTPFDALFLALSSFVIVAGLLLVALLMRLAMEQRASEYGLLLALGWPTERVVRMAILEVSVVIMLGGLLGISLGAGYAAIVLRLLRGFWVGAVTVPFLELHLTLRSLFLGWLLGVVMAGVAVIVVLRRLANSPARELLAGGLRNAGTGSQSEKWGLGESGDRGVRRWVWLCSLSGLLVGGFAIRLQGPAQGGAFVASGMLLLVGMLLAYRVWLGRSLGSMNGSHVLGTQGVAFHKWSRFGLNQLAASNGRRQPLRSVLAAGLVAIAGFLILSMGAFRLDPQVSGTGGFDLMGTATQPIYRDLSDRSVQIDLLANDAQKFSSVKILMLRERIGDDASCNNLYQAARPRVLGVPKAIEGLQADVGDAAFRWTTGEPAWSLLRVKGSGSSAEPIPVVIDQNTAMWSLGMRGGIGEVRSFEYENGTLSFRVVGLLSNSVLQGSLLISEDNFTRAFPLLSGYQRLLVRSGDADAEELTRVLENRLSDSGVDVRDTKSLLAGMLEVQNTYLRTFQGLGALGLLLGTFGLAAAQLRSVYERRAEFALLQAVGFSRQRIFQLVLTESLQILGGGLLIAILAALAALLPYAWIGQVSLSWKEPATLLMVVCTVGTGVSLMAARRVLLLPVLRLLRQET